MDKESRSKSFVFSFTRCCFSTTCLRIALWSVSRLDSSPIYLMASSTLKSNTLIPLKSNINRILESYSNTINRSLKKSDNLMTVTSNLLRKDSALSSLGHVLKITEGHSVRSVSSFYCCYCFWIVLRVIQESQAFSFSRNTNSNLPIRMTNEICNLKSAINKGILKMEIYLDHSRKKSFITWDIVKNMTSCMKHWNSHLSITHYCRCIS